MDNIKIFIFPTDTVYGMGVRLRDEKSFAKIYEIKKRNLDKKLPLLVSSINSLNNIANYNERDFKIMDKFWPGGLTVILNTTEEFKEEFKIKTIAVRIPRHEIALQLLNKYGPLWTTSVNESGSASINDIEQIKKQYSKAYFEIYEDNNDAKSNKESTIVDLTDPNKINFIREGFIKKAEILGESK